jgi:hypothetical protein
MSNDAHKRNPLDKNEAESFLFQADDLLNLVLAQLSRSESIGRGQINKNGGYYEVAGKRHKIYST